MLAKAWGRVGRFPDELPAMMKAVRNNNNCAIEYNFARNSKTVPAPAGIVGRCCPDSCARKASNNEDVRVADHTYIHTSILSVFVVILQLKAWSFTRLVRVAGTSITRCLHVEDAYRALYLYRSWDENTITFACLDAASMA